jgi:hypothetical protein
MKIIITERQLTYLNWYEDTELFEKILNNIMGENFYYNYVMFKSEDDTVIRVINKLYDDWSYKRWAISGEETMKDFLYKKYSNIIRKKYRETKKEHPNHKF